MTEIGAEGEPVWTAGAGGLEVRSFDHGAVRCYFSEGWIASSSSDLKADALAFWSTINNLFQQTSVIPFRFPTLVADEAELRDFLARHSEEYSAELQRLRGLVQMKVTITIKHEAIETEAKARSGTEYLKQRQSVSHSISDAIEAVKASGNDLVREWKRGPQPQKNDSAIFFALIKRSAISSFKTQVTALDGLSAHITVSGPWPPTEFVNCYPEVSGAKK